MLGKWYSTGLSLAHQMNRHLTVSQRSLERISTGLRINRAADDPAGLAISEKMRAQIRGLQTAGRNIQDGISMLQTAEGALNETHSILQRMRELSVEAANDTLTDTDRKALSIEFDQLKEEISRIARDTEFNTMPLLNGEKGTFHIQAGANAGQTIELSFGNMSATALGLDDISIEDRDKANDAMEALDKAIQTVSSERSKMGAYTNRLEHAYNNVSTMEENLVAAESRIRDADLAKEMMDYTKAMILLQANQYVMRLHMQQAYSILKLLEPPSTRYY
ncbi:flagellin [Lederbergia galactosidilytica]|uniref:Flagellin n=1 Tax=Lederbergia galactosidilytica TaxID=217031 RepID=A0A177ZNA6_9BACI|nr:flagellin [Lederbergia galactosidilytica]KRG14807.1 flagellin [Virgibacillus soli]MBP1914475.1 flagellin [Lederbergia galactosidilytica]OAK69053.1 flagellin [Lederbergia galactosidilytica]